MSVAAISISRDQERDMEIAATKKRSLRKILVLGCLQEMNHDVLH
jgi:hypothetical protein